VIERSRRLFKKAFADREYSPGPPEPNFLLEDMETIVHLLVDTASSSSISSSSLPGDSFVQSTKDISMVSEAKQA
jgi:hypothetical protein